MKEGPAFEMLEASSRVQGGLAGLIRAWSPEMEGITATIWASQTTLHPRAGL